jgi:LPXTG-motif cell wall-anchored protein
MKKFKNVFLAFFVTALTSLNLVLPAYAEEITTQTVDSAGFSVSVVGDGSVTLSSGDFTKSLSNGDTFNANYEEGTEIKIVSKSNENAVIDDVTLNNSTISGFTSGKKSFSFVYTTKTADANFSMIFKSNDSKSDSSTRDKIVNSNDKSNASVNLYSSNDEDELSDENSIDETKDELSEDGIHIDFNVWDKSDTTKLILKDYSKNIYKKYSDQRKDKAQESGLLKYCDSNYFLKKSFYSKYDGYMLNYDNLAILDKYSVPELSNDKGETKSEVLNEIDRVDDADEKDDNTSLFNLSRAGGVTVDSFTEYTWVYDSYGSRYNEAIYGLSNGVTAFCGEGMQAGVRKGQSLRAPEKVDNAKLAKVLYYGYGGHGDILTSKYGASAAVCMTSDMASKAYSGTTAGEAGGTWSASGTEAMYNHIQSLPLPSGITVYTCKNDENGTNWQGTFTKRQAVVYSIWNPLGKLQIKKTSANTSITDNNSCYSLANAVYGVYKSESDAKNDKNRVSSLKTNENGWSNTIELNANTYYLKEVTPPKGYALSSAINKITVTSGKTTQYGTNGELKDYPQADPVGILLGKVDKETNKNKPQGSASLAGAEFTVKYYKGLYDSDPAKSGQIPARSWVLKTDKDGFAYLDSDYKVFGDDFYMFGNIATIPVGTITIQETKAPTGYFINNEVFVRKIEANGKDQYVSTYNQPTVNEKVIKFDIKKLQAGTSTPVSGAVFRHTLPNGSTEDLETNGSGEITITGLASGTHKIKEIKSPDGYQLNPNEVVFNVASGTGKITFTSGTNSLIARGTKDSGDGYATFSDKVNPFNLKITKTNEHGKVLKGAEFRLYSDEGCKNVVDTQISDDNGLLTFKNLDVEKTYYFQETKAPQGYRIPVDENGKAYVHSVYVKATPQTNTFDFTIDNVQYNTSKTSGNIRLEGTKNDRIVSVDITNKTTQLLPETGSNGTILLIGLGVVVIAFALYMSKKEKLNSK